MKLRVQTWLPVTAGFVAAALGIALVGAVYAHSAPPVLPPAKVNFAREKVALRKPLAPRKVEQVLVIGTCEDVATRANNLLFVGYRVVPGTQAMAAGAVSTAMIVLEKNSEVRP